MSTEEAQLGWQEARTRLRDAMLAAATAAVPGVRPMISHDPGPVDPATLESTSSDQLSCAVIVETADPARQPLAMVSAARTALVDLGWAAQQIETRAGQHRMLAARDDDRIVVIGWNGHPDLTVTGETTVQSVLPGIGPVASTLSTNG